MRCHSPGGGLAAASGAPILGPLAGWGVGACWGQVAGGHCLETWLAPSIARKPRKSQPKFGSEKAAGQDVRLTDLGTDGCIQVAEGLKNSQAQWEVGCVI